MHRAKRGSRRRWRGNHPPSPRGPRGSPTLGGESSARAAALAVLDWHDEADICATLAETGREMRASVDRAIAASGVRGVHSDGVDTMWLLRWDDPARESRFLLNAVREGVLL